jgi:hypothetical protein
MPLLCWLELEGKEKGKNCHLRVLVVIPNLLDIPVDQLVDVLGRGLTLNE